MSNDSVQRRKAGVALLSVFSNTSLVALKLIVGLAIGSVSIISEAIHSGVDLVAALIAFIAVKTAGKPADEDHPFGHGKVENISGTVEALLIFVAAGWIIYEAAHKITRPQPLEQASWGAGVMLISAAANWFVSSKLFKVGRETESIALEADGWHLRTDVYTSAGVMVALVIIWAGRLAFPSVNLDWVDPAAAIAVAMLIVKAAWQLTTESMRDLLDSRIPADEESWIGEYISSLGPEILDYHDMRTRRSGSTRFIEIHLTVDSNMTVQAAHDISSKVSSEIKKRFEGASVIIHVDPAKDVPRTTESGRVVM